jgi:hypothetical protein
LHIPPPAAVFGQTLELSMAASILRGQHACFSSDAFAHAQRIAVCVSASDIASLGVGLPLIGVISDALTPVHGAQAIRYATALSTAVAGFLGMFVHWRVYKRQAAD